MNNLRQYQNEAVESIIKFYNSNVQNAKIIISTGLGSTKILVSSIVLLYHYKNYILRSYIWESLQEK